MEKIIIEKQDNLFKISQGDKYTDHLCIEEVNFLCVQLLLGSSKDNLRFDMKTKEEWEVYNKKYTVLPS